MNHRATLICLVPLLLWGCVPGLFGPAVAVEPEPTWLEQAHANINLTSMSDQQKQEAHRLQAIIGQAIGSHAPPSFGDSIRAAGIVAAPLFGSGAPLALVGTSLLAAVVTALERNARKRKVVRSIVGPLDASRRRDLEAKLATDDTVRGDSFIVIDKAVVAPVHAGNGAAGLIAAVTG